MAACRLDPPGRLILLAVWRVWFESRNRDRIKLKIYKLPKWLLDPGAAGPGIIISEVHYPIEARGVYNSSWLHILERSLYTGGGVSSTALRLSRDVDRDIRTALHRSRISFNVLPVSHSSADVTNSGGLNSGLPGDQSSRLSACSSKYSGSVVTRRRSVMPSVAVIGSCQSPG